MPPAASSKPRGSPAAFTLIELLCVIAVIGILSAILIPVTGRVRQSARTATCASNLRQVYVGIQMFASDNKGRMPNSMAAATNWHNRVAPYANVTVLANELPGSGPDYRETIFLCPSVVDDPSPQRSYALNSKLGDGVGGTDDQLYQVGNPSKVALIADAKSTSWLQAKDHIQTTRHGGSHGSVLYCDGHVVTLNQSQLNALEQHRFIEGK